jgi:hypothetical protein
MIFICSIINTKSIAGDYLVKYSEQEEEIEDPDDAFYYGLLMALIFSLWIDQV